MTWNANNANDLHLLDEIAQHERDALNGNPQSLANFVQSLSNLSPEDCAAMQTYARSHCYEGLTDMYITGFDIPGGKTPSGSGTFGPINQVTVSAKSPDGINVFASTSETTTFSSADGGTRVNYTPPYAGVNEYYSQMKPVYANNK